MRTFLALDLPDEIRSVLADQISHLKTANIKGIKWVEKENLHITFQFIGETQRHDLNNISDIMEDVFCKIPAVSFSSATLEVIPRRDPRLIWISVQAADQKISNASKRCKKKLKELGYKIENKPLKFHITLGRIKKRLPDFFIQEILTAELKIGNFEVEKASLYQSFLRPEGPIYEEIINYYFKKE